MAPKPAPKQQASKVAIWDFRYHASALPHGEDDHAFYESLRPHFKSATWQLEKCPQTGNLHYQGRGSLHKKIRKGAASIALSKSIADSGYLEPTADPKRDKDHGYQCKADSHVRGPWNMAGDPPKLKVTDVKYLEEHGLPAWGQAVDLILKGPVDPRTIYWIADLKGNRKKSAMLAWWFYHGTVTRLPYVASYKDLLQAAHGRQGKRAYCVNLEKSLSWATPLDQREFRQFLAGCESIKDGYVYDTRQSFRDAMFSRPHLLVLANQLPMFEGATMDRWCILDIDDNGALVDKTEEVIRVHKLKRAEAGKKRCEDKLVAETKRRERLEKFLQERINTMLPEAILEVDKTYQARRKEALEDRSRSPRRQAPVVEPETEREPLTIVIA